MDENDIKRIIDRSTDTIEKIINLSSAFQITFAPNLLAVIKALETSSNGPILDTISKTLQDDSIKFQGAIDKVLDSIQVLPLIDQLKKENDNLKNDFLLAQQEIDKLYDNVKNMTTSLGRPIPPRKDLMDELKIIADAITDYNSILSQRAIVIDLRDKNSKLNDDKKNLMNDNQSLTIQNQKISNENDQNKQILRVKDNEILRLQKSQDSLNNTIDSYSGTILQREAKIRQLETVIATFTSGGYNPSFVPSVTPNIPSTIPSTLGPSLLTPITPASTSIAGTGPTTVMPILTPLINPSVSPTTPFGFGGTLNPVPPSGSIKVTPLVGSTVSSKHFFVPILRSMGGLIAPITTKGTETSIILARQDIDTKGNIPTNQRLVSSINSKETNLTNMEGVFNSLYKKKEGTSPNYSPLLDRVYNQKTSSLMLADLFPRVEDVMELFFYKGNVDTPNKSYIGIMEIFAYFYKGASTNVPYLTIHQIQWEIWNVIIKFWDEIYSLITSNTEKAVRIQWIAEILQLLSFNAPPYTNKSPGSKEWLQYLNIIVYLTHITHKRGQKNKMILSLGVRASTKGNLPIYYFDRTDLDIDNNMNFRNSSPKPPKPYDKILPNDDDPEIAMVFNLVKLIFVIPLGLVIQYRGLDLTITIDPNLSSSAGSSSIALSTTTTTGTGGIGITGIVQSPYWVLDRYTNFVINKAYLMLSTIMHEKINEGNAPVMDRIKKSLWTLLSNRNYYPGMYNKPGLDVNILAGLNLGLRGELIEKVRFREKFKKFSLLRYLFSRLTNIEKRPPTTSTTTTTLPTTTTFKPDPLPSFKKNMSDKIIDIIINDGNFFDILILLLSYLNGNTSPLQDPNFLLLVSLLAAYMEVLPTDMNFSYYTAATGRATIYNSSIREYTRYDYIEKFMSLHLQARAKENFLNLKSFQYMVKPKLTDSMTPLARAGLIASNLEENKDVVYTILAAISLLDIATISDNVLGKKPTVVTQNTEIDTQSSFLWFQLLSNIRELFWNNDEEFYKVWTILDYALIHNPTILQPKLLSYTLGVNEMEELLGENNRGNSFAFILFLFNVVKPFLREVTLDYNLDRVTQPGSTIYIIDLSPAARIHWPNDRMSKTDFDVFRYRIISDKVKTKNQDYNEKVYLIFAFIYLFLYPFQNMYQIHKVGTAVIWAMDSNVTDKIKFLYTQLLIKGVEVPTNYKDYTLDIKDLTNEVINSDITNILDTFMPKIIGEDKKNRNIMMHFLELKRNEGGELYSYIDKIFTRKTSHAKFNISTQINQIFLHMLCDKERNSIIRAILENDAKIGLLL